MLSGLLWYDGDGKKPVEQKFAEARTRYQERFGHFPNCCQVSPGSEFTTTEVAVRPNRWIRPGFFWIGVDESLKPQRRAVRESPTSDEVNPTKARRNQSTKRNARQPILARLS
jgi:hypothetical protein